MTGRRHVVNNGGRDGERVHNLALLRHYPHKRSASDATLTTPATTTTTSSQLSQLLSPTVTPTVSKSNRNSIIEDVKNLLRHHHDASSRAASPARSAVNSVSSTAVNSSPGDQVMASPPSSSKMHASPSKGTTTSALTSSTRTYDAKLVAREMQRLGTLAHQLPSAVFGNIASATATAALNSASNLVLPTAGNSATITPATAMSHTHGGGGQLDANDGGAWAQLHVHVLPLFNHEQLQSPIEDLNILVRKHIEAVMARAPSRALATLEVDVAELINSGMITLNSKLSGVEDDKLIGRVVEIWTFFWDQVLPYVEGVFIPLQTDSLLISLYRTPKPHRPSSPTLQDNNASASSSPIDVRTIAIRAFRDKIIVPVWQRLETRLLVVFRKDSNANLIGGSSLVPETAGYQQPRLQQMLLVLHSQAQRSRPALSLTAPAFSLTPQELAVRKLLDALRTSQHRFSGIPGSIVSHGTLRRAPSFLSGGAPRDRRGRIGFTDRDAENAKRRGRYIDDADPSFDDQADEDYGVLINRDEDSVLVNSAGFYGGMTPRGRGRSDAERERDRSLLESLRSPNPVDSPDRTNINGMGLGREDQLQDAFSTPPMASGKMRSDQKTPKGPEDADENMDWDQVQVR